MDGNSKGRNKIINEMLNHGLQNPEFADIHGDFVVTFYGMADKDNNLIEKSSEKILGLINGDKEITIAEIAQRLGRSNRAVEKQISKLKDKGILRRVGPDKGGHRIIIE